MSAPAMPAKATRRRWLILSHAFNMDGRAASLTVTDKLPFLEALGIEPVVISGAMGTPDARLEHHRLLPWGPAGLRFDLRHVVADRLGRGVAYRLITLGVSLLLAPFMLLERLLLGLRHQWSWAIPAWWLGRQLIKRGDIELVYTSGGAYSAHLAGRWLKRSTGCRWIAEVHDPIVLPGVEPATRDARFQAELEGQMCREADLVWWFTDGALAAAAKRHPQLGPRGLMVLPGANPPLRQAAYQRKPVCTFGHFGSLSVTRSLGPVLQGLAALLQRRPELAAQLCIEVYGGGLDPQAESLVQQLGLQMQVRVIGRLEHDPATGLSGRERVGLHMQQMDWLLMVHGLMPDTAEYIPSKLYDYLWSRRPVLALTHRNPQLDALVRTHGGRPVPNDDVQAIAAALEAAWADWAADRIPAADAPPVSVEGAVRAIAEAATRWPLRAAGGG